MSSNSRGWARRERSEFCIGQSRTGPALGEDGADERHRALGLANLDLLLTPAGAAVLDRLAGTEPDRRRRAAAGRDAAPGVPRRAGHRRAGPVRAAAAGSREVHPRRVDVADPRRLSRLLGAESPDTGPPATPARAGGGPVLWHRCDLVALAGVGAYASSKPAPETAATADTAGRALRAGRGRPGPLHLRMPPSTPPRTGSATRVAAARDAGTPTWPGWTRCSSNPARRSGGRRLRTGDSEPPLAWCVALAERIARVAIKAAPGWTGPPCRAAGRSSRRRRARPQGSGACGHRP